MFQESFKDVSRPFKDCFKDVSKGFQGSTRLCQETLKVVQG